MPRLHLLSPAVRVDPYPYYAELRRSPPTQIDPGGLWAVSRYDDVVTVLREHLLFSSQGFRSAAVQPWLPDNPIVDSLIFFDPPRHTSIRALVTHAFSARVLPRVEPLARDVARRFAIAARDGVELDVCQELALTLPAGVLAVLLGFDGSQGPRFQAWADDLHSINAATTPEEQRRIVTSIDELRRYIQAVFEERRRRGRADLASDLLDAEIDGEHLTEAELIGFMFQLLVAGFETTGHLLAQAIRALAAHPELVGRLRAHPGSIPAFVDEVARHEPSVHGLMRLVLADTTIGGAAIPAGSIVLALLGSANRDETRFEEPDRFDMDRRRQPNLAFGHGIHFCLGAALARAEARIALEELLPRISAVRETAAPEWNRSLTVRGPVRLPVVFSPSAADDPRPGREHEAG